jgi:hypothetical protein
MGAVAHSAAKSTTTVRSAAAQLGRGRAGSAIVDNESLDLIRAHAAMASDGPRMSRRKCSLR